MGYLFFFSGFGLDDKVDLLILHSSSELTLTGVLDSVTDSWRAERIWAPTAGRWDLKGRREA